MNIKKNIYFDKYEKHKYKKIIYSVKLIILRCFIGFILISFLIIVLISIMFSNINFLLKIILLIIYGISFLNIRKLDSMILNHFNKNDNKFSSYICKKCGKIVYISSNTNFDLSKCINGNKHKFKIHFTYYILYSMYLRDIATKYKCKRCGTVIKTENIIFLHCNVDEEHEFIKNENIRKFICIKCNTNVWDNDESNINILGLS